jgi:hypothetical protein
MSKKFYGRVGYGQKTEIRPGVWVDQIVERAYRGEEVRVMRKLDGASKLNDDISVNNQISILADAFALEHFFDIRYVEWAGALWKVPTVELQRPRLILWIGEVYNGPKAGSTL